MSIWNIINLVLLLVNFGFTSFLIRKSLLFKRAHISVSYLLEYLLTGVPHKFSLSTDNDGSYTVFLVKDRLLHRIGMIAYLGNSRWVFTNNSLTIERGSLSAILTNLERLIDNNEIEWKDRNTEKIQKYYKKYHDPFWNS